MYIHCKLCDWEQDDFWNLRINFKRDYIFGYNPLSCFIRDFLWLIKPRIMKLDQNIVDELIKYTHIPVVKKLNRVYYNFFSWNWLLVELIKNIKKLFTQKWWTYKSWQKALRKNKGGCPVCGSGMMVD